MVRVTVAQALQQMHADNQKNLQLIQQGQVFVGMMIPTTAQPSVNRQDEIYIVASGTATFLCNGATTPCGPGDLLAVEHGWSRGFQNYTADFALWYFVFGPVY